MSRKLIYNPLLPEDLQYVFDETELENFFGQTLNLTIYETITVTASNSGAVTPIANTTIDPNHFGAIGAAIVSETSGGYPTNVTPKDINGDPITATITVGGTVNFSAVVTGTFTIYYGIDITYRNYANLSASVKNRVVDDSLNVERGVDGITVDDNGNIIFESPVIIESGLSFGPAIDVPITGNVNNLVIPSLSNGVLVRFIPTGNFNITGIVPVDITKGGVIYFTNASAGANSIQLLENNAGSLAQNRILAGGNKTVQKDESGIIVYDTVSQRNRVFSINI